MSRKKSSTAELVFELGVVMEQVQVISRGLKDYPNDEIFQKGAIFMKGEAEDIMKELARRRADGCSPKGID